MSAIPYATMTGAQIAALRIHALAHERANMFLWCASRNIGDAFLLAQLWGFRYRGLLIWRKPLGLGLAMRHEVEFLLWAARSGARRPANGRAIRQIYDWPRPRRHSEKPAEAYELIRSISDPPRIDLFARQQRPGFVAWGNEAPGAEARA